MKTLTRSLVLSALALGLATSAMAQLDVTVREANKVPQANIDALIALGGDATQQDVDDLVVYELEGVFVQFTAVVLSDPYNSGLASWNSDTNQPNRVHVFVRDTNAVLMGYEGMTTQLVDGSAAVVDMEVGDVYTIQGDVSSFNSTIQINPTAFENLGSYQSLGLPDEIMDPIIVTTDELNSVISAPLGGTVVQINWANYNDYNAAYVRMEDALVTDNDINENAMRYSYQWSSSGTDAVVNSDDISIRFRNDRSGDPDYPNPPWNSHPDTTFFPPAIGAAISVQGFALYRGFDFTGNSSTPPGVLMVVSPWYSSDLEVSTSPPIFGEVQGPTDVVGNEVVPISVEVTPDPSRTITSVELDYYDAQGGGFGGTVAMTDDGGGTYSGDIPAAPDGLFVGFTITATDSEGAMSTTSEIVYRVLYNGIENITQIQLTPDGLPGDSPFEGITTSNIDVEAVVQADFEGAFGRRIILQDDPALGEWSGIWVDGDGVPALSLGDQITITTATITESFGVTQLEDIVFSNDGPGAPYDHKVLTTGVLNGDDPGFQEAHEGILVRFENITVTDSNADGPENPVVCQMPQDTNFGEFQASSDGSEANEVRFDDLAEEIFTPPFDVDCDGDGSPDERDPAAFWNVQNLGIDYMIEFVQGPWYYSFGAYKLTPTSLADIGAITVSNEPAGPAVPGTYRLHAAYPNPFNPTATIRYEVGAAGPVTLKVYDALGREVAVLVDGTLAPSIYEATFDASGLSSGIYMYRLVAGSEVLTGSLTLVK
ncbi:MAG: T9SS type A sorting domain-containing protein [Bacteroidetes bacterium]|nr:T9SS type A sorting domain-containing protein [Bacteroidota bacterium]